MTKQLNVGLIGCGEIAAGTTKSIQGAPSLRVVQCMDIRRDIAENLAKVYDAPATDGLDDVLSNGDVQAVIISTPHYEHAPVAIAAAKAGKHVLVEKPIARILKEADAMIDAADRAGVKLCVFQVTAAAFDAVKAGELIRGGAIGNVAAVKLHGMACKPESYWHGGYTGRVKDDWRMSLKTSGGGFLIMNQIHQLGTMVAALDLRPERIYAEYGTFATPVEVEDFISFVMRLKGGAIFSLDGSSAAIGGGSFGDHIYGTKGHIVLGNPMKVHLSEPWGDLKAGEVNELSAPEEYADPRARMAEGFARAVLDGGQVPFDGRQGRRALEIVRGAYLSMKRGRPVSFPVKE